MLKEVMEQTIFFSCPFSYLSFRSIVIEYLLPRLENLKTNWREKHTINRVKNDIILWNKLWNRLAYSLGQWMVWGLIAIPTEDQLLYSAWDNLVLANHLYLWDFLYALAPLVIAVVIYILFLWSCPMVSLFEYGSQTYFPKHFREVHSSYSQQPVSR